MLPWKPETGAEKHQILWSNCGNGQRRPFETLQKVYGDEATSRALEVFLSDAQRFERGRSFTVPDRRRRVVSGDTRSEAGGFGGGGGGGSKSHVCDQCGRSYRHASSLLNHKNSHKTGTYFCNSCQKEFPNLMSLKNHRRIHTEPKRYQCPDCGKSFRVSTALVCHRRIHTKEKPFSCQQCDKDFSSKSNLRHHMKVHWRGPTLSRGTVSAFLSVPSRRF